MTTAAARDQAALALALAHARRRACPDCRGEIQILWHEHPAGDTREHLDACTVPTTCRCGNRPAVLHTKLVPGQLPGTRDVVQRFDQGGQSFEAIGDQLVLELLGEGDAQPLAPQDLITGGGSGSGPGQT
jgi:hypothetical protein